MSTEIKSWMCRKCNREKPLAKFRIRRGSGGQCCIDNICKACRGKMLYARYKLQMLEAFGWKCSCCGVEHPYFLTLEHVNGGRHFYGKRYGREGKQYQQSNTYVEIARAKADNWDRTKWECLCWNCNCAKGKYGQCPHRTGITKEQVIESLKVAAVGIGTSHRNPLGGEATRYKTGISRPEMVGNKHYPKARAAHGRFSKEVVEAELQRIELASE